MTVQATYRPSGNANWNAGISAGLDYWAGRDGSNLGNPVVIVKGKNYCGEGAVGCAAHMGDGTCVIWIAKDQLPNRWALTAIALHETGHCLGHPHDDFDLVMHS